MLSNYEKRRSRDFLLPWHLKMVLLCTEDLSCFDSLFSKVLIKLIQLKCSSTTIPRNLIEHDLIHNHLFNASTFKGRLSLFWNL